MRALLLWLALHVRLSELTVVLKHLLRRRRHHSLSKSLSRKSQRIRKAHRCKWFLPLRLKLLKISNLFSSILDLAWFSLKNILSFIFDIIRHPWILIWISTELHSRTLTFKRSSVAVTCWILIWFNSFDLDKPRHVRDSATVTASTYSLIWRIWLGTIGFVCVSLAIFLLLFVPFHERNLFSSFFILFEILFYQWTRFLIMQGLLLLESLGVSLYRE